MTLSLVNHRLDAVPFRPSPNTKSAPFAAGRPDALIIHFTGGSSAESAVAWLCNPVAKASAHVVVGRDGSITQLVPFDIVAWHAGESSYGGRSGYNQFSIGIEIDNPGRLRRTAAGTYVSSFGRIYPPEQVITAVHRNESQESRWLTYTDQQIDAVFELCSLLCSSYAIREILGHEEIAPGRKDDPGPAFPLDKLRQRLIIRGRDSDAAFVPPAPSGHAVAPVAAIAIVTPDDAAGAASAAVRAPRGYVAVDKLNFRAAPRVDAPLVSPALTRGTLVDVLDRQPGWYQVQVRGTTGWVKAEYLKT